MKIYNVVKRDVMILIIFMLMMEVIITMMGRKKRLMDALLKDCDC